MNANSQNKTAELPAGPTTELLVLPDGRILVHNLTTEFAGLLSTLNPEDADMARRATPPNHGHCD